MNFNQASHGRAVHRAPHPDKYRRFPVAASTGRDDNDVIGGEYSE